MYNIRTEYIWKQIKVYLHVYSNKHTYVEKDLTYERHVGLNNINMRNIVNNMENHLKRQDCLDLLRYQKFLTERHRCRPNVFNFLSISVWLRKLNKLYMQVVCIYP